MNAQRRPFYCVFVFIVNAVLSKGDMSITRSCAGGNVTLEFNPVIDESQVIQYYIWYKTDLPGDTSFAKFITEEKKMEIYVNDVKGRLIHNYDDPSKITNLKLDNVRDSDASKYNLVVRYKEFTQNEPEYKMELKVQDVCFETPKQKDGCAVSTCFTGDNGMLKWIDDSGSMNETVNGNKMVTNCQKTPKNYSCCNAKGTCLEQLFQMMEKEEVKPNSFTTTVLPIVIIVVLIGITAVIVTLVILQKKGKIHLPCFNRSNQGDSLVMEKNAPGNDVNDTKNDAEKQPLQSSNEEVA